MLMLQHLRNLNSEGWIANLKHRLSESSRFLFLTIDIDAVINIKDLRDKILVSLCGLYT